MHNSSGCAVNIDKTRYRKNGNIYYNGQGTINRNTKSTKFLKLCMYLQKTEPKLFYFLRMFRLCES